MDWDSSTKAPKWHDRLMSKPINANMFTKPCWLYAVTLDESGKNCHIQTLLMNGTGCIKDKLQATATVVDKSLHFDWYEWISEEDPFKATVHVNSDYSTSRDRVTYSVNDNSCTVYEYGILMEKMRQSFEIDARLNIYKTMYYAGYEFALVPV